jgi:hypothetical protein
MADGTMAEGTYEFTLARRYLSGDQMYQDFSVYFTPLSVYWNALLIQLLPGSVAVISLATLLSCVIMVAMLAFVVYRETGRNYSLTALFFFSTMYLSVYKWPRASYSWNALLVSTFAVAVLVNSPAFVGGRVARNSFWIFSLIGFLLGVASGVKQNIGFWMIVVFLGWIVYREVVPGYSSLRRMVCDGFALVVGACMVPAAISFDLYHRGTLHEFIKIFTEKPKVYAEQMSVSFFSNFVGPASIRNIPNWILDQVVLAVLLVGLLASVLCVAFPLRLRWTRNVATAGRFAAGKFDARTAFWAILYLVSFVSLFPRADYPHVRLVLPFCFAALCVFVGRLGGASWGSSVPHLIRRFSIGACLIYSCIMLALLVTFTFQFAAGKTVVFSEFPARGTITSSETATFVRNVREAVVQNVGPNAGLLIAHPSGSFFYPFLGVRNRTPFDYFHSGALTRPQVLSVVSAIDAREIKAVLIDPRREDLSPEILSSYAAREMELKATINDLQLFVSR